MRLSCQDEARNLDANAEALAIRIKVGPDMTPSRLDANSSAKSTVSRGAKSKG